MSRNCHFQLVLSYPFSFLLKSLRPSPTPTSKVPEEKVESWIWEDLRLLPLRQSYIRALRYASPFCPKIEEASGPVEPKKNPCRLLPPPIRFFLPP